MKDLNEKSKFMSLLLRHKPEVGNIKLDSLGYTDVNKLLTVLDISKEELDEIVRTDNKKRYSYNEDETKIRANQGHSVKNVHIDFKEYIGDKKLYHGSAMKYFDSIMKNGLCPQTRQYVHLSQDIATAINVGMRHAKTKDNLVIFEIDTKTMKKDGYKFYISDNNVVLTECIPEKYLKIVKDY